METRIAFPVAASRVAWEEKLANPHRRIAALVSLGVLLAACAGLEPASIHPPILFVHGAGGHGGMWMPTIWRFESNGWPRDRLFAMNVTYPRARDDDSRPQPDRSSAAEHAAQLKAEVERIRRSTGASKVILVANSRGGLAVRDYIRTGGGKEVVSHAVLGGTPNHGIWNTPDHLPGHEMNAAGPYLAALNAPQGPTGLEVTPGVAFLTIRSDTQDKWTQPHGLWLGKPDMKTGVTHDSPELKGAENVVLPGADHLQVSYGPEAFHQTYRFVTGRNPATTRIIPERRIVLDGKLSSSVGPTNVPIAGAVVEVFEVSRGTGERLGPAVHRKVTGADGAWGPFEARQGTSYEIVKWAEGHATTHTYRAPFPRSSSIVHMRIGRLNDEARKSAVIMTMIWTSGFFGMGRDQMALDGKPLPGIMPGVPGLNFAVLRLDESEPRSVAAELNGERIVARTWPTRENRIVRAEFHQ
jgi:triacylglycerol lipase